MPLSSALPLNVTSAASPKTPVPGNAASELTPTTKSNTGAPDITSPHELTAFVETLLERLDTRFDEMSSQILDRMAQMSTRVDTLEASLQDVISGDITTPIIVHASSAPASPAHFAQAIQRSKSQNDTGSGT